MNVETFLIKLFGRNCIVGHNDEVLWLSIRGWPIRELQENMDLLARELHMEVEEKAKYIRKIKHDKIKINSSDLLKEIE